MGIYNGSRLVFDGILEKYKEYLALYRLFNKGSIEGATSFGEFYWRFAYHNKYSDNSQVSHSGY